MGALHLMSLEQETRRAFAICDSNNADKLTKDQLAFFLRALGSNPTKKECEALPDGLDYDAAVKHYEDSKKEPMTEDEIRALFEVWDRGKKGVIDFGDMAQCLKIFGSGGSDPKQNDNFSDQEIEDLMKQGGVEGSKTEGTFVYEEFLQLMVQTQTPHLKASLEEEGWPKGKATVYK